MGDLLHRYRAGDRARVWTELRRAGLLSPDSELWQQAEAVALETMDRARENVRAIEAWLRERGYRFAVPAGEGAGAAAAIAAPDLETPAFLEWFEAQWGPLDHSFRAWVAGVGDVSLLGHRPGWPDVPLDPLVVEFEYKSWVVGGVPVPRHWARSGFVEGREEWEYQQREGEPVLGDDWWLPVAPDRLHKADISGGPPYAILAPTRPSEAAADASFRYEDGVVLPFVEYLRHAFSWGGFPGIAQRDVGPIKVELRKLARELLPL